MAVFFGTADADEFDLDNSNGPIVAIYGFGGRDSLSASVLGSNEDALVRIDGGNGNDSLGLSGSVDTESGSITADADGGEGDDTITITTGDPFSGSAAHIFNRASGGDGRDLISVDINHSVAWPSTRAINDLSGGARNDEITAHTTLNDGGDIGPDDQVSSTLSGGLGSDKLTSTIYTFASYGDIPRNVLYGGDGDDRLTASLLTFEQDAPSGASELYGGTGDDRLKVTGGNGNFLTGNQGNDTLLGSTGADRMIGGQGDDYLRGYAGDDTFEFQSARNGERDRIDGFAIGDDVIDISRIDANAFRGGNQSFTFDASGDGGTGKIWVEDYGTRSIVHADTGRAILDIVLLDGRGVDAGDYGASDFIL